MKIDTGGIPAGGGKGETNTLCVYILVEQNADNTEILSQNVILLLPGGRMVDCAISQDDGVEKISIMARSDGLMWKELDKNGNNTTS